MKLLVEDPKIENKFPGLKQVVKEKKNLDTVKRLLQNLDNKLEVDIDFEKEEFRIGYKVRI